MATAESAADFKTRPSDKWTLDNVISWAKEMYFSEASIGALTKGSCSGPLLAIYREHDMTVLQTDIRHSFVGTELRCLSEKFGIPIRKRLDVFGALKQFMTEYTESINGACPRCNVQVNTGAKYFFDGKQYYHWQCWLSEPALNREQAKTQLEVALDNNIQHVANPQKQYHHICSAIGFPGIGKTTIGWKVASALKYNSKDVAYAYVDFSNGDAIYVDHASPFETQVAMRVFLRLLTKKPFSHISDNNQSIYICYLAPLLKENVSLARVLEFWQSINPDIPAAVLHFDEINYLSAGQRKELVQIVASVLLGGCKVPFVPLISGTTHGLGSLLQMSGFFISKLNLQPLKDDEQLQLLLQDIPSDLVAKLIASEKFHYLKKSTLGIPRIVIALHSELQKTIADLSDSIKIDADSLVRLVAPKFKETIGILYKISDYLTLLGNNVLPFTCICLRGKLITLQSSETATSSTLAETTQAIKLPGFDKPFTNFPGFQKSFNEMMDDGYIHISDDQQIQFPYILASQFLGKSQEAKLFTALGGEMTCKQLEVLEPIFLQLLVASYNKLSATLQIQNVVLKLDDVWCSAITSENIKNLKICIPKVFCTAKEEGWWISANQKLMKNTSANFTTSKQPYNLMNVSGSFTAADKNPLVDVRTVFELFSEDNSTNIDQNPLIFEPVPKNSKQRTAVSSSIPRKVQRQSSRLLNLVQMKHSANTKTNTNVSDIYSWYKNITSIEFPDFYVVYTYYTTKAVTYNMMDDEIYQLLPDNMKTTTKEWTIDRLLALCPCLVIMSFGQLTDYLSPTFELFCKQNSDV